MTMSRLRRSALSLALIVIGTVVVSVPGGAQQRDRDDEGGRSGCAERRGDYDDNHARHCEERETRLQSRGGAFVVDARENGGVVVRGWSGDSVLLRAVVNTKAESEAAAAALAKEVRVVTEGTIHAEGPATTRGDSWWVTFELYVPRRSDLTLDTRNGPISVRDVTGRMQLRAVNGPLALARVGGDVHGRTTNGPIHVSLSGNRWEGTGLDAETSNGPVTLSVPASYSAHLVTGTQNGPMELGIPLTVQGRIGRHIETDIGSGGATVRAVTTNGPLTVERGT
jgi:hypothetical protein